MRFAILVRQDHLIQPQRLANGPRLKWTATRGVRRFGVCDFGNVAKPGLVEMGEKRPQRLRPPRQTPDEPRPDRALMIRAITFVNASYVMRPVIRLARSK